MITASEIRRTAGEDGLDTSVLEKDYVLGWVLYGISESSIGRRLAFKGGTALSKIYYPGRWRLSEDLDFTPLEDTGWDVIIAALESEIPQIIKNSAGIESSLRARPHTNPDYLQARLRYAGPASPNTVKIEMTRECFVGDVADMAVPAKFDYPRFSVMTYSIETIMAEKMRAIIQRGYIRDYDVWRMLGESDHDVEKTREFFLKKCRARGIEYSGTEQFFPQGIEKHLEPYVETGLGRLMRDDLLPVATLLAELRHHLEKLL